MFGCFLPMRRSPKMVKRVPRHASDLTSLRSLRKQTFNGINDDLRNLYDYESKPIMGSKTPDDHRRGPNGMGKKSICFAL